MSGATRLLVPGSLKVRLALTSIALILASVALTVVFVLREVGRSTEQMVLDSQEDDAQRLAATISQRLVGLQRSLRSVAQRFPVAALAETPALIDFIDRQPVLMTLFSSVFAVSPEGDMLVINDERGPRDPHLNVADRAYFRNTLAERRPLISRVNASRVSGAPVVVLTMPIFGKDGSVAAVFGGTLRLSDRSLLDDLTQTRDDRASPILTVVADSTGEILFHPDKAWLLRDAESEPNIAAAIKAWKQRGRPIEPAGYSLRAGDFEVGIAGVPDADWLVLRSARADVLLGGVLHGEKRARWLSLGVALGGGALTLLMTFIFLRPLARLKARALGLLVDGTDVDAGWPQMRGELGELSKVFRHVIRERQAGEAANQALLVKMRAVMAKAPVGIAFTKNRRFELVSDEFNRLLGYDGGGLEGQLGRLLYASDEFYEALGGRVGAAFAAEHVFAEEVEFVRRDGTRFWGQLMGAPVKRGDPQAGTIWTLEDVSQKRQERSALSWAASHDALTGLANRHEFEARIAEHLADRRPKETACLLFIDLDDFKTVNDTAGHAAGDQLLKDIAKLLLARIRIADAAARLGGDEFAVFLQGCALQTALTVAEELRERVDACPLVWQGRHLRVGVSIGVVQIDDGLVDVAAVIAAADEACYAAKRSGRNRVRSGGPALRLVSDTVTG